MELGKYSQLAVDDLAGVVEICLDIEVEVATTAFVLGAGAEQPYLCIGAEVIGDGPFDRLDLSLCQSHRALGRSGRWEGSEGVGGPSRRGPT
mgnify:CR=1 FL=1